MREMQTRLHLVKQMMEERRREAAREAMQSRHSRTGLLSRFLDGMADRIDATGTTRRRRELPD